MKSIEMAWSRAKPDADVQTCRPEMTTERTERLTVRMGVDYCYEQWQQEKEGGLHRDSKEESAGDNNVDFDFETNREESEMNCKNHNFKSQD